MAKKNYIGNYKGQNCFVAEFGTAKDPDELEETFNEIQDMLDEELTQSWEANDRSQDDIYLDAEYSVFHQEYIDTDHPEMPSVSLMIVPDGKRYTLFMRIGSK